MNGVQFLDSARKLKKDIEEMLVFLQQETSSKDRIEWSLASLNKQRNDLQVEIENIKSNIKSAKDESAKIINEANKRAGDIEEGAKRKIVDETIKLNKIREEIAALENKRYKLKNE